MPGVGIHRPAGADIGHRVVVYDQDAHAMEVAGQHFVRRLPWRTMKTGIPRNQPLFFSNSRSPSHPFRIESLISQIGRRVLRWPPKKLSKRAARDPRPPHRCVATTPEKGLGASSRRWQNPDTGSYRHPRKWMRHAHSRLDPRPAKPRLGQRPRVRRYACTG